MSASNEANVLRIGDYVLLKDVARSLFLAAEGILRTDVECTDGVDLNDSLFCVHLQRQYSASRDLNAFLEIYNSRSSTGFDDESSKKYLDALQKGRENEKKLNDNYMRKKQGQIVEFGGIIQLFHVKSGKYLTVVPGVLAKEERENTRVTLDANGNAFSWIQVYPRFKINKEGDKIMSPVEVYLKVAERANEYLHSADRDPLPDHHREVNCALEQTSWKLTIFQSSKDAQDKHLLLTSQLVYINDPESHSNITISKSKEINIKAVTTNNDDDIEDYYHHHGDITLEASHEHIDSNYLWVPELQTVINGGPIAWKTDLVRFRHFNTGYYLLLLVSTNEDDSELVILTKTRDLELPGTLFSLSEINSTNKYLGNSKAVQICSNGTFYLERGEVLENSVFSFALKGTRDKGNAVSLIIHRYGKNQKSDKEDDEDDAAGGGSEEASGTAEPLDVYSGFSSRMYLRKYYNMLVIPKSDTVNTVWPTAISTDLDFFQLVLDKTVFFSQGFPISAVGIRLGIDKGDTFLRTIRQNLLREQNTLEVVLQIINKLIPMTEKYDRIKANASNRKKKQASEEELSAVQMSQLILRKCFELVHYCIIENPGNQMYVADCMTVLLAHLNSQPLAGKCVTEMLSKNMELQETKIGTREIQIFVDKLRSSKMNEMYLQLLQACCSCEGQGVDGNQCKVANMLFSNTNDIIIQLHANYGQLLQVSWDVKNSLYLLEKPVPGSPIRGESLISKGLPQLSLAWTTNSIDYSPLGLFGKLSVNVEELFRVKAPDEAGSKGGVSGKMLKSKKKSSMEQKQAVANYFVAELFLGAEMCMDRNYIAMHQLDNLFPFDVLITLVKLNIDNKLRSAAVRLLMCLYVDRDPQASSKIPCLTRTWTDIKKHTEPQLPFVDTGRRYVFGLIQQLVSDHLHNMAGNSWDDLSRHMLAMLRTLVSFNFYGTNERMKDVVGPLIAALDRRKVAYEFADSKKASEKESKKDGSGAPEKLSRKPSAVLVKGPPSFASGREAEEKDNSDFDLTNDDFADSVSFEEDKSKSSSVFFTLGNCCVCVLNILTLNTAAQILQLEGDEDGGKSTYKVPVRYSKAPLFELEAMVEAVDILAFAQRVIEDRNISLLLRSFFLWDSGADKRSPAELFEQAISDSQELTLGIADFDNIMIDVIMYVHTPLVQSTLEVLMAHHSKRKSLLDHAKDVQLLASHKRERQFKIVDQMLQQLEQNAETQELWGELETDAHYATSKQTKDILIELTDICRTKRETMAFNEDYEADVEIQNLYRNLGCFDICMKVLGLLDSIEGDDEDDDGGDAGADKRGDAGGGAGGDGDKKGEGEENESDGEGEVEESETAANTREICKLCNALLYWFFNSNFKNQELGYGELRMFLDTLDENINSHLVIHSLFTMNETLMKMMPHVHLSEMVDKIVKDGKKHHYLALFAAIPNVGEKNIVENQFEIVKSLTSPGRFTKVSCFFCPISSPDYAKKRELMEPFLKVDEPLHFDQLPPLLAYHLLFLDVLSGCTVGRTNVTAVEAKVQSVFSYVDIVDSILDSGTILVARICMSKYLFNAIIEVELIIPGLDQAACIWKLMEHYVEYLQSAADYIKHCHDKGGLGFPGVNRQRLEYIVMCLMIISGFFSAYYEPTAFKDERQGGKAFSNNGLVNKSKSEVDKIITALFDHCFAIFQVRSRLFSDEHKQIFWDTCDILQKAAPKQITTIMAHYSLDATANNDSKSPTDRKQQTTKTTKDENEMKLIKKYQDFVQDIATDDKVLYKSENENVAFVTLLETLPFISDPVDSDLRYESLIKKLVTHIRENIQITQSQKRMDPRFVQTSWWIIKAFKTMIENRMGMSIYERDEEGGQEQDLAAAPVVNALNTCGATALCLDLIADGIDEGLQMEAIKLGVGLLFKEGGALEVQTLMNRHLTTTNSALFFKQVRIALQKLQSWHTWNGIVVLEEGQQPEPPQETLILRMLQLMCEGHFLPNQDIMREQPNNPTSYNLLDDFVNYLNALSRLPCQTSTASGIRLSATILEVIQGPCSGNQLHFALNTELVETLNRINRAKVTNDCIFDDEVEMKKTSIDIFQGLLEGQGSDSVVYDRVLSVIHLDIISSISKGMQTYKASSVTDAKDDKVEMTEAQELLQTECVVLLQMLCNFKPSLYDELGISRRIEDIVGSGTVCIEVIWRGDIHRRFFHVPSICGFLAKSSKDALVNDVDRSNSENKLIDFLARAHDMYREVKHQQLLTEMGISGVFSRESQNRATWITFWLTVIINLCFLFGYELDSEGKPVISPGLEVATTALNLLQTAVALFTLVLWTVVRIPVNYQSIVAEGSEGFSAIIKCASDTYTVYYVIYLIIALLGVFYANYFVSLLLLDIIVKNSTTQAVLNAIVTPWFGLLMGSVLQVFTVYIYSFFLFWFYREDIEPMCYTLWDCFKTTLSYGLQNGGGIADALAHSTSMRLVLDFTFFAIVLIILLNVIMGMIIDTFSSLRAEKNAKDKDTQEVCFICGIGKQVFDRASDEPNGFQTHIKVDHNMWNYMYFIFMLWEQDRDDDDGLEQFARLAIEAGEISWFPSNKAIRLAATASSSDVLRSELKGSISDVFKSLTLGVGDFEGDVYQMLNGLVSSLKMDPSAKEVEVPSATSEDGADIDDGSVITLDEDSNADAMEGTFGINLDFALVDISGLELDGVVDQLGTFCRVLADNTFKTIEPDENESNFQHGKIIFDHSSLVPLMDNIEPGDKRTFSIQILQESTVGKQKFIASFDFNVVELTHFTEVTTLTRAFSVAEDGSDEKGSITFVVQAKHAKSFTNRSKVPDEKDKEKEEKKKRKARDSLGLGQNSLNFYVGS